MSPNSTFFVLLDEVNDKVGQTLWHFKQLFFPVLFSLLSITLSVLAFLGVPFCPVFNDTLHISQNLPSPLTPRHSLTLTLSKDPLDGVWSRGTLMDASSVPIACIHFLLPDTEMSKN